MTDGDLWRDRWRLTARAPSRDALERWRAQDTSTGDEVEIHILRGSRSNQEGRRDFVEVHRALTKVPDDALVPTIEVHHDGDLAFAVRTPLHDSTLADLRGPLPAELVAAIGARLLPALLAAGSATRGALLPSDVGISDAGHPVLAIRGAPLTQVVRGTTRAAAPEAFRGGIPDGPAGLYGLGVLLYRLATGREPMTGPSGAQPPPPSAVRHGIPDALDQGIQSLLAADPARRAAALPLLQDASGELPDLRSFLQEPPAAVPVRTGTRRSKGGPSSRQDTDLADLVLISADDLRRLTPAQRSHAAGLAGVPLAALEELVRARLPLVVDSAPSPGAARNLARDLAHHSGLPIHFGVRGGVAPWAPIAVALAVAGIPLILSFVTALFGVWLLALPLVGVAVGVLALGVFGAVTARNRRALHRAGTAGLVRVRAEVDGRAADRLLTPAYDQLAAVRAQLGTADLPTNANTDVRGVLKDLESRLDGLSRRATTSERALRQVDATNLRTRLGALTTRDNLTPAEVSERDRLARTVADLDAVLRHRRGAAEEATRIRDALAEIAAALGQLGEDPSEALLEGLGRAARGAATAVRGSPLPSESEARARAEAARRSQQREGG